jgi:hypothetical protein
MKDRASPERTAEPWTDSVDTKEQQGTRRESHATQKLKSDKEARRRDDKSPERGQEDPPAGTVRAEDIFKHPRARG